jgi:cell division protein FtsZ
MDGARGVLLSIAGPSNMTLHEVSTAAALIADHCDADANIIFGATVDDALGEEMRVTVVAAGFDRAVSRPAPKRSLIDSNQARLPVEDDDLDIPGFVRG